MSLIYDNPWLINQLLQSGMESENKFSKQGQNAPAPAAPPDQDAVNSALQALLENAKATQTPMGPEDFRPTENIDLGSQNMDSLGDFVEWLDTHGKKDIAVKASPDRSNKPSEDYWFCVIEPGTEIVTPLQTPSTTGVGYWINRDALKAYLLSLQKDEKLKTIVPFQIQLLKLIQYANKQLDVDISETYQAPEKPDTYPLDMIPQVLMPSDSKPGLPTNTLTYGDLKSPEALVAFLTGHNIGLEDAQNTLTNNPDKYDLCGATNILFYRAQRHSQLSARPEDTERFKIYLAQLKKAAPQGCQLTGGVKPQQPGQQPGGGSGVTPGDMAVLQQLAGEQLFDVDSIDLNKIAIFADTYAAWANRPDITALKDKIHASITDAQKYLAAPGIIQVSNMSIKAFRDLAKSGNMAPLLATTLDTIISYAGRMVIDLVNMLKRNFKNGAQASRSLEQQVAQGGPQQANLLMLQQMFALAGTPGPQNR